MVPLLLAADIGNWIGLAILVISVLGWIVNAIKGNEPQANPAQRRPRPKPNRDLRSEIEVFLEELQHPKPDERRAAEAARREAPKPPPRPRPEPQRKPRPAAAPPRGSKGKAASSKAGSGVREHVATYMAADRVTAEVKQHLGNRVADAVNRDLSGGTVAPVEQVVQPANVAPHPLLVMLSKPEGVRQAIVISEILQRPRVLRERPGPRS